MTKRKFLGKDMLLPACILIVIVASCLIVTITAVVARITQTAEEKKVMSCMKQLDLLYQEQDIQGMIYYENENWNYVIRNQKYKEVEKCYSDISVVESSIKYLDEYSELYEGEDLQTTRESNAECILGGSIDAIICAREAIEDDIVFGNEDLLREYLKQATSYVVDFCGFEEDEIEDIIAAKKEEGYHWKQYVKQTEKNIP